MTVPSEVNRSGPYPGNGVATVFDYDFRIVDAAHLQVIKADATGEETTLVLTTDYTVAGVGNDDGSITTTVAPATGETITILRNVPFTQDTDLENQGPYFAEVVEAALDLAVMRDQQLEEKMNRAVLLPPSADDSGGELSAQLAAGILRLADSADEIDTVASIEADVTTVAGISADVALLADNAAILSGTASAIYAAEDIFVGDGVDTTWTLSTSPASEANVDVWIGGAIQTNADISVAGNVLTITPAVANGVTIIAKTRVYVSANDVYEARDEVVAVAEAINVGAFATAAQGAKADTAIQPGTIGTTPFAVYASAQSRSLLDRSHDFVVVTDLSDGSGAAADDDSALAEAISIASGDPNKCVLLTRNFKVTSEKTLATGIKIAGAGRNIKMLPQGNMRSVFNITGSRVWIDGIYGENSSFANAQAFFRVQKGWDNLPCTIEHIEATGFSDVVEWVDGDCPMLENFRAVNNKRALNFINNGMNGKISNINVLGGQGLLIFKAAGGQQMEGTNFYALNILPGDKVNGVNVGPSVDIQCGLALRFFGLLVDQVWHSSAVHIKGTAAVPVNDIQIHGLWLGTNVAVDVANVHGLFLEDAAQAVHVYGGQVTGFTGIGVALAGQASLRISDALVQGVRFSRNGRDFYAAHADGQVIGNVYGSTTDLNGVASQGVYEVTATEFAGFGNYYAIGPAATFPAVSQHLQSRGPGSPRGLPSSSAGLTAGKLWVDGAAGSVVKAI